MIHGSWETSVPVELHGNGKFLIPRSDFLPAYLKTYEEGRLKEKIDEGLELLRDCTVCPRHCHVNRLNDERATCKSGRLARVSAAFPHFGEEDCLRGWNGSGTIFFSWCNLRCVFCQNFETSHLGEGAEVTPQELAGIMLRLQGAGCHNINFVTPEHVVPHILEALEIAIECGLRLPLVYNTGAYDSLESIHLMDGVVDVYMPDFKLWNSQRSLLYLKAEDYSDVARCVIKAMHDQVGELNVDEHGLALRGVLVRHLLMPDAQEDTREIIRWIGKVLSCDTYVNIMDQYYPAYKALTEEKYSAINRRITNEEFRSAITYGRDMGLWRFDTRWRMVVPKYQFYLSPQEVLAQ